MLKDVVHRILIYISTEQQSCFDKFVNCVCLKGTDLLFTDILHDAIHYNRHIDHYAFLHVMCLL